MEKNEFCVDLSDLLKIAEELNHNKDLDSLLDNILREARKSTGADAGSIFIAEKNNLKFSYVQNDTISQREQNKNKYIYSELTVPIDTNSIAGYVAVTGKNVNIPDAYNTDSTLPFTLNRSFDEKSNYKTISILAVPLVTSQNKTVGVMQLINSIDSEGNIRPFTENHEKFANFIAANASVAVERALMTRQNILRMVKMSELRDPKETGNHVNRVGSYCVEIYDAWSRKNGIDSSTRRRFKDILKIGAMLHDVGKVAISDKILKKPSKLDDEEYKIMKRHSKYGADLFDPDTSDLDAMCHDIALNHHEKWNGTGYPKGLKEKEIPFGARICAIADVFDALISKRVYKERWNEEEVLEYIRNASGKDFDPELVESFTEVYETVSAIRRKYPDVD